MNDKADPLISIITPVYNGADYLDDLINSVLKQSYKKLEHIIIDDGSNDGGKTTEIIKSYPHVRGVFQKNKGQYATINEGIKLASGELINIISADDMLVWPDGLASIVKHWQQNRKIKVVYGRTIRVDEAGKALARQAWQPAVTDWVSPGITHWFLKHHLFICHCSMIIERDLVIESSTFWDESYKGLGDWEWLIRLYSKAGRFSFMNTAVSYYRYHVGQISLTQRVMMQNEARRICQTYGANYFLYTFLQRLMYSYAPRLFNLLQGKAMA